MQHQSSLGSRKIHRAPSYNTTKIGRVTSVKDYEKWGRIEVVFLDYGQPLPVWVVGDIERKPVEGDHVIIGYIDGRRDAPYLIGFVKNKSYTTNFIRVEKDKIRIQLPVFDVGVKNGTAHNDVKGHLLDESKLPQRAYVELSSNQAKISFPTSKSSPPAHIKITSEGMEMYHPTNVTIQAGANITIQAESKIVLKAPSVSATNGKDLSINII